MSREEILQAVKALPHQEKLALAEEILQIVDEDEEISEAEWDAAWGEKAERRLKEIEDGTVTAIPGEEVMARVRARRRS